MSTGSNPNFDSQGLPVNGSLGVPAKPLQVLFVDDDSLVLQAFRRMLQALSPRWEMRFATSGAQAIELVSQDSFDVLVSDVRMPGIDGLGVLEHVQQHSPETVRVILSGAFDMRKLSEVACLAHQILNKPCSPSLLKSTIDRICALRNILNDKTLRQIVGRVTLLPSTVSIRSKLATALNRPECDPKEIGLLVTQDVGLSARVLQLANSPFFGVGRPVRHPSEACHLLGLEIVKSLAVIPEQLAHCDELAGLDFSLDRLVAHSLNVAHQAEQVTQRVTTSRKMAQESFTAGLLHDIGELILAVQLPMIFGDCQRTINETHETPFHVERRLLGVTHAEIGAYLLGLWGLPLEIVEAVAFHHKPSQTEGSTFSAITAVHLADSLEREETSPDCLDTSYLPALELLDQLPAWQQSFRRADGFYFGPPPAKALLD